MSLNDNNPKSWASLAEESNYSNTVTETEPEGYLVNSRGYHEKKGNKSVKHQVNSSNRSDNREWRVENGNQRVNSRIGGNKNIIWSKDRDGYRNRNNRNNRNWKDKNKNHYNSNIYRSRDGGGNRYTGIYKNTNINKNKGMDRDTYRNNGRNGGIYRNDSKSGYRSKNIDNSRNKDTNSNKGIVWRKNTHRNKRNDVYVTRGNGGHGLNESYKGTIIKDSWKNNVPKGNTYITGIQDNRSDILNNRRTDWYDVNSWVGWKDISDPDCETESEDELEGNFTSSKSTGVEKRTDIKVREMGYKSLKKNRKMYYEDNIPMLTRFYKKISGKNMDDMPSYGNMDSLVKCSVMGNMNIKVSHEVLCKLPLWQIIMAVDSNLEEKLMKGIAKVKDLNKVSSGLDINLMTISRYQSFERRCVHVVTVGSIVKYHEIPVTHNVSNEMDKIESILCEIQNMTRRPYYNRTKEFDIKRVALSSSGNTYVHPLTINLSRYSNIKNCNASINDLKKMDTLIYDYKGNTTRTYPRPMTSRYSECVLSLIADAYIIKLLPLPRWALELEMVDIGKIYPEMVDCWYGIKGKNRGSYRSLNVGCKIRFCRNKEHKAMIHIIDTLKDIRNKSVTNECTISLEGSEYTYDKKFHINILQYLRGICDDNMITISYLPSNNTLKKMILRVSYYNGVVIKRCKNRFWCDSGTFATKDVVFNSIFTRGISDRINYRCPLNSMMVLRDYFPHTRYMLSMQFMKDSIGEFHTKAGTGFCSTIVDQPMIVSDNALELCEMYSMRLSDIYRGKMYMTVYVDCDDTKEDCVSLSKKCMNEMTTDYVLIHPYNGDQAYPEGFILDPANHKWFKLSQKAVVIATEDTDIPGRRNLILLMSRKLSVVDKFCNLYATKCCVKEMTYDIKDEDNKEYNLIISPDSWYSRKAMAPLIASTVQYYLKQKVDDNDLSDFSRTKNGELYITETKALDIYINKLKSTPYMKRITLSRKGKTRNVYCAVGYCHYYLSPHGSVEKQYYTNVSRGGIRISRGKAGGGALNSSELQNQILFAGGYKNVLKHYVSNMDSIIIERCTECGNFMSLCTCTNIAIKKRYCLTRYVNYAYTMATQSYSGVSLHMSYSN